MDNLVEKIVDLMNERQKLKVKREIIEFGLKILLNECVTFLLVILISILLNQIELSIIFILLFSYLREYSGGYHASTYWKCRLCYISLFLSNAGALYFFELNHPVLIALICNAVLWSISPVDCAAKRIASIERSYYRKRLLHRQIITMIIIAFLANSVKPLSEIACMANLSVLLLALIQKVKNGKEV